MLLSFYTLALCASLGAFYTVEAASADAVDTTICGDLMTQANDDAAYLFFASDVHACLKSVPFYDAPALRFLDYYNTTLQFQSTLAFLKSPPGGYQQPSIDVEDILRRIQTNVTEGYYQSQYDFEVDVQKLVLAIHDAHVELEIGITSPFVYGSPYSISSVSIDGKEPPKVYMTDDIIQAQRDGWSWEPSAISQINGRDVVEVLTDFASLNSKGYIENHAEWNALMSHPTQDIQGWLNIWSGSATFYPGDELTFTFENASHPIETYWISYYTYPKQTGPIATGGDMYNFFALGLYPATNESAAQRADLSNTIAKRDEQASTDGTGDDLDDIPAPPGDADSWYMQSNYAYPRQADVHQPDLQIGGGVVSGYFLHGLSTGVLSLPSFSQYGEYSSNFTNAVQEFVNGSVSHNLSNIIIDLQQNSGGQVSLVIDTFLRFFPGKEPFAGSRRRSHLLGNVLGNATSTWWSSLNPDLDEDYGDWWAGLVDEWVIKRRVNAETQKTFASWDEYAGPKHYLGDEFTLVEKYNLTDDEFVWEMFNGFLPSDYLQDLTPHWDPKNIVLLTDGLCSSACSLFVELMTRKGARTVVMGGRPTSGPMQAASGSRGARAYASDSLDLDFAVAGEVDPDVANKTLPEIPANAEFRNPGLWSASYFNLRDQIRESELDRADAVPLQFRYEAADCRLYYTLRSLYNMTQQWADVYEAAWGRDGSSRCVAGSTGYATTGQTEPAHPAPPLSAVAEQHRPFPVDYAPPAKSAENVTYAKTEPGATDITDKVIKYADPIHRCADGKVRCGPGLKCKDVDVKCGSGRPGQAPPSWKTVPACLPACHGVNGCIGYQSGLGLECVPDGFREQKRSPLRSSVSSSTSTTNTDPNSQRTVPETRQLYAGLCYPKVGNQNLGCPADKPAPSRGGN